MAESWEIEIEKIKSDVKLIGYEIDTIKNKIPEIMTSSHKKFISLKVPIKVDIGVGNSWDDAH